MPLGALPKPLAWPVFFLRSGGSPSAHAWHAELSKALGLSRVLEHRTLQSPQARPPLPRLWIPSAHQSFPTFLQTALLRSCRPPDVSKGCPINLCSRMLSRWDSHPPPRAALVSRS